MSKEEKWTKQDKEIDLKNYNGGSGASLKRMNFGLWLAEHRRKITKLIIVALILLSAFFFIYSSYNYILYFVSGDPNAQIESDNISFAPRKITNDLETSPLSVFSNNGHSDLAVKISNPNEKFMATFNYCFKQGAADIFCGTGFIFPNETKHVLALAQTFVGSRDELSYNISNVFWRRIDAHKIPNWADFHDQRLDFAILDLKFASAATSGLSDKLNLNTLEFSVRNNSAFGYYEMPLNIFLANGQETVAVNRYIIQNFLPGETRAVKISFPGRLNSVNRTEVIPDINIMDEQVFLKYQGIPGN